MYDSLLKDFKKLSALYGFDILYYIFTLSFTILSFLFSLILPINSWLLVFVDLLVVLISIYFYFRHYLNQRNIKFNSKNMLQKIREEINRVEEEGFLNLLNTYHLDTPEKIKLVIDHFELHQQNNASFFCTIFALTNAICVFCFTVIDITDKIVFVLLVFFLITFFCGFKKYTLDILLHNNADKSLVDNLALIYCNFKTYKRKMRKLQKRKRVVG